MTRFTIAVAVALMIASVSTTSAFARGVTAVTECGEVLLNPGKYQLTQDLLLCPEVSYFPSPRGAITIASSGVTLNLKGHTITCDLADDGQPHFFPGIWVQPD